MKIQVTKPATEAQIKAVVDNEAFSKSQKMKDLFQLGLDVKDIAALMQVRYNFVYNVVSNFCTMNGIQVDKEAKEGKKDQIIELFLAGKSNKDIAITLKTNYNYVFNVIKAYKKQHPELEVKEAVAE